jgi:hypothetical protein
MPLKLGPDTLSIDNAKLPFAEQIEFFKSKAGLKVGTDYFDDVEPGFHRRGFMVAGAQKAALLSDLYDATLEVIEQGQSIDWFRKRFDAIVETHGWAHRGAPGIRAATIYDMNMASSYARGRYEQLMDPELLAVRPYWRYELGQAENHRPLHASWAGLTLRYDDPWWQVHRPVRAWRCHCWVSAVAEPTPGKDSAPPDTFYQVTDRHGEIHTLPAGVDYGCEAGENWKPDPKNYADPIAKALEDELTKVATEPPAELVKAIYLSWLPIYGRDAANRMAEAAGIPVELRKQWAEAEAG